MLIKHAVLDAITKTSDPTDTIEGGIDLLVSALF